MTGWGATATRIVLAALIVAAGCSSDDDPEPAATTADTTSSTTTTTAPERPASTTTTAFDPASVEGEVEAAYLRSWDVYADAVYNLELDEEALAAVYAERSLRTRTKEIEERIEQRRSALVRVEHDYQVSIVDSATASVVDAFINHQVLIDPETKQPVEDDPNERLLVNFQLKRFGDQWKVTLIQKVNL